MFIQTYGQAWVLSEAAQRTSKPVVVFVPESWHDPHIFHLTADLLDNAGYDCILVHNPEVRSNSIDASADDDTEEDNFDDIKPAAALTAEYTPGDKEADVKAIRAIIEKLVPFTEVIVFAHGRGAIPACEAVKDLDVACRKQNGLPGGVLHLILCAAFLPVQGQSILSAYGEDLEAMETDSVNEPARFYSDLSVGTAKHWVRHLRPYTSSILRSTCNFAGWQAMPTTYILTEKDTAVPTAVQQKMVEKAGSTSKLTVVSMGTGHSPFLSVPYDVVKLIRKAAGEKIT